MHYSLRNLVAQGNVSLRYTEEFSAKADRAIYREGPHRLDKNADELTGMIYLVPDGTDGTCEVFHGEGDHIEARLIRIDTDEESLFFDQPVGQVYFEEKVGMLDRIEFRADALFWDDRAQQLSLQHNVGLTDIGIGTLYAEREVSVSIVGTDNLHQIERLRTQGPTHLVLEGESPGELRELYCFDGVDIDNKQFLVHMHSPTKNGAVVAGKQLRYRDKVGEIQADTATIYYQLVNSDLEVDRIVIEGNVYIVNHASFDPADPTPVLQYAIADKVEYFAQDQVMMLSSQGRRVLFFDKLNNIQVSAPAIRMSRDRLTGKEAVKGLGDVRLRLIGQEMDRLLQPMSL